MEYDIDGGNTHPKEIDVDHAGIAWVSGQGGTRGYAEDTFLLEVAGVTPNPQDGGTPPADWLLA